MEYDLFEVNGKIHDDFRMAFKYLSNSYYIAVIFREIDQESHPPCFKHPVCIIFKQSLFPQELTIQYIYYCRNIEVMVSELGLADYMNVKGVKNILCAP